MYDGIANETTQELCQEPNVQLRNIFKPLSKVKERKKIIIKKPQQPASQTILLNNKSFEFLRILN
ncbi:CLUMA_CG004395, isoform E [Clunio marinus]|uniref:CLUMA_CG004395, isoform E n=1 Tax=Clunio marinus TaxID=568069 RepID=A0A1J1HTJ1_9DIPT|nr:CLUMA_CG004395, isoform E [Clunio marinus]